jgi:hypothetical protein
MSRSDIKNSSIIEGFKTLSRNDNRTDNINLEILSELQSTCDSIGQQLPEDTLGNNSRFNK